jgi:hypothetical protein
MRSYCTSGSVGALGEKSPGATRANWNRDASSGPPSLSYPCVLCTAIVTQPPGEGCSCTIGKASLARRAAPWLMAGAFSLLFLFRRRRSR